MKLLSKLFKGNNPEGIREAMKLCYQKASGHNFLFDIDPKKHNLGMILALSSRYLTFGIERSPEYLSMELAPFFMISSQLIAVNALCEYVVFKELPNKANSNSLKKVLIDNIKYNVNGIWYPIVASCFQNNSDIPWVVFLKDEYFKS